MAARLGIYQKDVHMFKPGAKKRLEDFKSSCKKYVDFIVKVRILQVAFIDLILLKHVVVCNAWIKEDRNRQLGMTDELLCKNKEL